MTVYQTHTLVILQKEIEDYKDIPYVQSMSRSYLQSLAREQLILRWDLYVT